MKHLALAALLLALGAGAAAADEPAPPPAVVDTGPVPAIQRPLWELGLGATSLWVPDYRGSDQHHTYLLPFPYIVYRGKYLRSDREGTRAMLFDSQRVKLDFSLGAAAPARSSTAAREGMPDLAGNVEIGPSLVITLDQAVRKRWTLDLRLPVRAAVTVESSPHYAGATFSPNLNLDLSNMTGGWNVGLLTGPLFANRQYHAQYYQVDPAYATALRPAYRAHGGYAGWQTIASTSRRMGDLYVGGFMRLENLHGAVYEDSPLLRRKSSLTVGVAFSWVFATSSTLVMSAD